jgi:hypothetical protein
MAKVKANVQTTVPVTLTLGQWSEVTWLLRTNVETIDFYNDPTDAVERQWCADAVELIEDAIKEFAMCDNCMAEDVELIKELDGDAYICEDCWNAKVAFLSDGEDD